MRDLMLNEIELAVGGIWTPTTTHHGDNQQGEILSDAERLWLNIFFFS